MIKVLRTTIQNARYLGLLGAFILMLSLTAPSYAITTGEMTPLSVRQSFEEKYDFGWEDATVEEQDEHKAFLKKEKAKIKKAKERRLRDEARAEAYKKRAKIRKEKNKIKREKLKKKRIAKKKKDRRKKSRNLRKKMSDMFKDKDS